MNVRNQESTSRTHLNIYISRALSDRAKCDYILLKGVYTLHIFLIYVCSYACTHPDLCLYFKLNIGDIFDTANICLRDFLDANVYCSKCTKKVIKCFNPHSTS